VVEGLEIPISMGCILLLDTGREVLSGPVGYLEERSGRGGTGTVGTSLEVVLALFEFWLALPVGSRSRCLLRTLLLLLCQSFFILVANRDSNFQ
jgi:hypothetical protein